MRETVAESLELGDDLIPSHSSCFNLLQICVTEGYMSHFFITPSRMLRLFLMVRNEEEWGENI
jgi:hypothetical protein